MSIEKVNYKLPDGPCQESSIKKRMLWHSDRSAGSSIDYYADQLWLIQIDDGKWSLELHVGGTVSRHPIQNIEKYV